MEELTYMDQIKGLKVDQGEIILENEWDTFDIQMQQN